MEDRGVLSKERAFLFLGMMVAIVLLTGFPHSVNLFSLSTSDTITGGAIVYQEAELRDYLVGLVLLAALMVFVWYMIYALRYPKPQAWYPQLEQEAPEFTIGINRHTSLDDNLEKINRELKRLQTLQEAPEVPSVKNKKITKVPDIHDINLEHALRQLNAQLQGYHKKPIILQSPAGKGEWDDDLLQVKQKLAAINEMKIREAKVREDIPSMRNIALKLESRWLQQELNHALANLNKKAIKLQRQAAKTKWDDDLARVNKKIDAVDKMKIKKSTIREEMPSMRDIALQQESKRLEQELKESLSKMKVKKETKKVMVLEQPVQQQRWNKDLEKIKRELGKVEQMEVEKVKVLKEIPIIRSRLSLEERKLQQELGEISKTLDKEKNSKMEYRHTLPSVRERELAYYKKQFKRKGKSNNKELREVEKRLSKMYEKKE